MSVRINYIALPNGDKSLHTHQNPVPKDDKWEKMLGKMRYGMEKQLSEKGFLRLISMEKDAENDIAYYFQEITGILADYTNPAALTLCKKSIVGKVFNEFDTQMSQKVCHLPGGLLRDGEYNRLLQTKNRRRFNNKKRTALKDMTIATANPCRVYGSSTEDVYGVPVFRCAFDKDWNKPVSSGELLKYLIKKGFLPDIQLESGSDSSVDAEEFWEYLKNWGETGGIGIKTQTVLQKADENGKGEEKENWKSVMDYYCATGFRAANLERYPHSLFQMKGSWDLYRFVGLRAEELRAEDGDWYEVSGMYARNPYEDIASDAEYVAIDFGTTSTVAAVYQDNGAITTIPVGGGNGCGQVENPTILKFVDISSFLAAYEKSAFRPDTEFVQVSTSHVAKKDFETPVKDGKKNMLQYLNQLKQWINQPNRVIQLTDKNDDITLGREMDLGSLTVDPIELYAYYIGLSINDMRWGKIYLKYLLSYSATYSEYSLEWIRSSFEKGLRKALPPEVGEKAELDVRLWRDEATSYAICALSNYLMTDENAYLQQELQQGVFYGVYDFGGGTLDFSFGVMTLDSETEQMNFMQLQRGGSSVMGCENILDELAFMLFSENEGRLTEKNIKCNIPLGADPRQYINSRIADDSEAARFNTCSLVAYLRKKWINQGKEKQADVDNPMEEDDFDSFTLYGEDGTAYEWTGMKDGAGNGQTIQMDIKDEDIYSFFRKKVHEGIELFIDCYQKVLAREGNQKYGKSPCHVFLAGNASRASCVLELFTDESLLKDCGNQKSFVIHSPLSVEEDKISREDEIYLNAPTAKSGVAYGLLMSRPGAEDIFVKSKLPEVSFHYHIGRRTKSALNSGRGMFQILAEKTDIPKYSVGEFQRLRKIQQEMFEILYTFDDSYVMSNADRKVGNSIKVLSVSVPQECVEEECYLYIRALAGTDIAAEIGVSSASVDRLGAEHVRVVGICDFAHGSFEPVKQEVSASVAGTMPDKVFEPSQLATADTAIPSSDSAIPTHYQLGLLPEGGQDNAEPLWRFKTDVFQTSKSPHSLGNIRGDCLVFCYRGVEQSEWDKITVPLEGNGEKEVFVLNFNAAQAIVKVGYKVSRRSYVFYLNLMTRELLENYEGGNKLWQKVKLRKI